MIDWLIVGWYMDCLVDCLIIDWLIDNAVDWLAWLMLLINQLNHLIDWLFNDALIALLMYWSRIGLIGQ